MLLQLGSFRLEILSARVAGDAPFTRGFDVFVDCPGLGHVGFGPFTWELHDRWVTWERQPKRLRG